MINEPATVNDDRVAIAQVEDIAPGDSCELNVNGQSIALFHTREGEWIATDGRCPHEQGPLVDCILGNGRLTCPIHSYSYDIHTGVSDNPDIDALTIFPVEIRDGSVWIDLHQSDAKS